MIDLLKELIKIPSVHGNEASLMAFVQDYALQLGATAICTEKYVYVKIVGKNSNAATILCGHLDTVDPGTISSWDHKPYKPVLKNGKLYGLGSADMKAGIAVMLKLLEHYTQHLPAQDLWFSFVCNEEVDGAGAAAFVSDTQTQMSAYTSVATYILEPVASGQFWYGCKGNLFAKLEVVGGGGHASTPPAAGGQAIYKSAAILQELPMLQAAWQAEFTNSALGVPTITPTSIEGVSGSPNKLSESCAITLDIRTTPEIDEHVKPLLEAWAKKRGAKLTYLADHCLAGLSSLDTAGAVYLAGDKEFEPAVSLASSDLPIFTAAGIPAYLFGPGDMAQAHQPNEFVEVAQLQQYFDHYIAILEQI